VNRPDWLTVRASAAESTPGVNGDVHGEVHAEVSRRTGGEAGGAVGGAVGGAAGGFGGEVGGLVRELRLRTVCEEAICPNIWDCYSRRTATFLVLGDRCTRACRFCAVRHGRPLPPDPAEPARLVEAARRLGLRHVVITSVTRDDLPDGGAGHFAACVAALKATLPGVTVEVLTPDFRGWPVAVVARSGPDVFAHNIETVPRLYPRVRPGADYSRSLELLRQAAGAGLVTKSGLMVGLGETMEEIEAVLADLRRAGCLLLTVGQYLAPTAGHLPVERYLTPGEFESLRRRALALGFAGVAAGPLVRSSYRAAELLAGARKARNAAAHLPLYAWPTLGRTCLVRDLGRVPYPDFADRQRRAAAARRVGQAPDTLFFAEHDPVLTFGRDGGEDQVLVPPEVLSEKGISLIPADRGGSVTYHGPGQLMIYPVIGLERVGGDVHLHVRRLEEAVIRTLGEWGVQAGRRPGYPGVWVGGTVAGGISGAPGACEAPASVGAAKIAAIGIGVTGGVAFHGVALNLDPDLEAFRLINPCGLRDGAVTSVRAVLQGRAGPGGGAPTRREAMEAFCRHFSELYGLELAWD